MKIRIPYFFLVLFLLANTSFSLAGLDFKYGASARSYPSLSGDVNAQAGYGIPIWGTPGSGTMYGLIRPALDLSSSGVVYSYDANVTVYPISFIGLGVGRKELTSEYSDFTYYECEDIRCKGKLNKEYGFVKLALGYGNIKMVTAYTEFENTYDDEKKTELGVAEYEYILIVNPKEEKQIRRLYYLGYDMGDKSIGLLSDQHQFLESDKDYQLNIGFYQFNLGSFRTTVGIGSLQSSDQKPGVTGIFRISHTLLPSMALF